MDKTDSQTWMVLLVIAAFLVILPLFWTRIILLMARIGGWRELAKLYGGPQNMSGEVCRFASARFRMFIGYNRCLTITVSGQGAHLRPMILFRMGHEPLLIPWDSIINLEQKGLALFPQADMIVRSANPERPFKISFYGKRLVETMMRHHSAAAGKNSPKQK